MNSRLPSGTPLLRNVTASPLVPKGGKLTVGLFKERDGKKTLAMIANRDYKQPVTTSAAVQPAPATVEVFDPAKKTWSPVQHGGASNKEPI